MRASTHERVRSAIALVATEPRTTKSAAMGREQLRAAVKVHFALGKGKLVKPAVCSRCLREGRLCAHHHDYGRPLDVTWLCEPCHGEEHARMNTNGESAFRGLKSSCITTRRG